RILRQVAMRTGFRNLLDDARPLDLLAMFQLALERGIAGLRHRNLVNHFVVVLQSPAGCVLPPARKSGKIIAAMPGSSGLPGTSMSSRKAGAMPDPEPILDSR